MSKSVSTKSSKAKGAHHEIDINDAKAKKVTPNDETRVVLSKQSDIVEE